jgi:flagellar motor switch protein FliN/FliY
MRSFSGRPESASASAQSSSAGSTGGSVIRPLATAPVHDEAGDGEEDKTNQEMLMKVPLEISVEIGRTKRLVKDILEFTQGTLVVLDKMAGEQVDLFVNGQCIAKGDIVVVEDNFGIRITEIVTRELNPESL